MTQKDIDYIKENKEQVINQIATLIEENLDGDIVDIYFHLNNNNEMDYNFSSNQNTIMMMCADSVNFVKHENDRIADTTAIEMELDLQIEQHNYYGL